MTIDSSITKSQQKTSRWQEAIEDAKERITCLRKAIKYYHRMEEIGKPWPNFQQRKSATQ